MKTTRLFYAVAVVIVGILLSWRFGMFQTAPTTGPAATVATSSRTPLASSSSRATPQADTAKELPGTVDAPGPGSFNDLLSTYGPGQRRRLVDFYAGFPALMIDASNPDQLSWMRDHGYPMPEDVTSAAQSTTEELHARAMTGTSKDVWFWYQRLADAYGKDSQFPLNIPEQDGIDLRHAMRRALGFGDPFAGYVYAKVAESESLNGFNRSSAMYDQLAGYLWAYGRGDGRIVGSGFGKFLHEAGAQLPKDGDAGPLAILAYQKLLQQALRSNPGVLNQPVVPLPGK